MHDKEENYCRWNKRFDMQQFKTVYPSVADLGRIYVYLMDGSSPICFWKGNVADFQDPDPKLKWYPFTADLAVGSVTDQHKAGMFSMKMSINCKT
jgi:hypothetical protein